MAPLTGLIKQASLKGSGRSPEPPPSQFPLQLTSQFPLQAAFTVPLATPFGGHFTATLTDSPHRPLAGPLPGHLAGPLCRSIYRSPYWSLAALPPIAAAAPGPQDSVSGKYQCKGKTKK